MPNKKVLYLLKMKNKAVENPNDQAQISHRLDGIPPTINKIKWRDNKTPNPKPKNYNSAKRTLKYFLFGILLEIGIYHRHGRDPAHINNNKVAGELWIFKIYFFGYWLFLIYDKETFKFNNCYSGGGGLSRDCLYCVFL